ncbi:MAG: CDP-diacylglycerol--glycerol-3-phosphate 3-phosphatidyltransferase [Acidobacteria bacterium]|nr:CDP-diacylglycerol--glycerol-3-phosphate 3-phosphatidyltransferase [Acidobacteriota bacterium]
MNLANYLTISRMVLIPILVIVLVSPFKYRDLIGSIIFLTAALTDLFDGYIARKRGYVTRLGKILDPIADKLLISSALIPLVALGRAPSWMVVVILGREFAISGLRNVAISEGIDLSPSFLGKSKMTAQGATIFILILGEKILGPLFLLGIIGLWIVVALSLISAFDYVIKFSKEISKLPQNG